MDSYIVALYTNGKTTEALSLYEEDKKREGYEIDPQLEDLLAGKITLEAYFLN